MLDSKKIKDLLRFIIIQLIFSYFYNAFFLINKFLYKQYLLLYSSSFSGALNKLIALKKYYSLFSNYIPFKFLEIITNLKETALIERFLNLLTMENLSYLKIFSQDAKGFLETNKF